MAKIYFPLLGIELDLKPGSTVSDACELAGVPLNLVCGGNGTCNKCRADVRERGRKLNVQSCSYPVSDGMEVLVSKEFSKHQLLETMPKEPLPLDPFVRVFQFSRKELKTRRNGFYLDAIEALIDGIEMTDPPLDIIIKMNNVFKKKQYEKLALVLAGDEVIDFLVDPDEVAACGVAFDIGTTSIVGILYDLKTGKPLGKSSELNRQIQFGDDVVSRIDYCFQNQVNRAKETAAVRATVDSILTNLLKKNGVSRESVYEIVYCGNSTMQQLFLGLDPEELGESPFLGTISRAVRVPAKQIGFDINHHGSHVFMPLLGGFVGADTVACLLTQPRDGRKRMMIDLGTNGEIAITTPDGVFVTSTACGPALEGAGMSGGMRGTKGAIERFSFSNGTFHYQVIGGAYPIGYCGSGIVDIVATLLKVGILTKEGRFLEGEALEAHPLKDRLHDDGNETVSFVLISADENPSGREITVTQRDIRSVQLAKSAIYTGCVLLSKACGISGNDLDEINLAGAFGSYIDISNAQYIGLVPRIADVRVTSIGNAASMGAQRYLLSCRERKAAESIRKAVVHVELASDPAFQSTFMRNMDFGNHMVF